MTGARDPAADLECRLGPRYDGGRRSCLRIALYTYGEELEAGCTKELSTAYLCNGTCSDWVLIEFFKYILEWPLKYVLYDFLGVC